VYLHGGGGHLQIVLPRTPQRLCDVRDPAQDLKQDASGLKFEVHGSMENVMDYNVPDKNSSGDEIANVNFFYNIAHVEASAYAH